MKLSKLLLVGFTAFSLSACDLFGKKDKEEEPAEYDLMPEVVGGTAEEKEAIYDAINTKPICQKNGSESATTIWHDSRQTLQEDEGDNVKLTVKQMSKGKQVEITWGCDNQQEYFSKWLEPADDTYHKFIEVKYKGYSAKDTLGSLSWKITKLKCGDAVSENPNITYTAKVQNEQIKHETIRIAEAYAFDPETYTHEYPSSGTTLSFPSRFDVVDYDKEYENDPSPFFKTTDATAEHKNYFVNVTGKVVYLAPDGNFGLIADGDEVMELYAGSGTALKESNFPHLKVGNVVKVTGNLAQYCGNMQVGWITKILEGSASDINPVDLNNLTFREMTKTKIASLTKEGFTSPSQAVKVDEIDMMGSLRSVTGTFVAGSMKQCDGKAEDTSKWTAATPASMVASKRTMFKLQIEEGVQYTVYYDKHSNSTNDNIFNALKAKLEAGGSITVKGFSRYFGDDAQPFIQEGKAAAWTVVPFHAGHIA